MFGSFSPRLVRAPDALGFGAAPDVEPAVETLRQGEAARRQSFERAARGSANPLHKVFAFPLDADGSYLEHLHEVGVHATHVASSGGVTVLFRGSVAAWPGESPDRVSAAHDAFVSGADAPPSDDAAALLRYYKAHMGGLTAGAAAATAAAARRASLAALAALEGAGAFAFLIHDLAACRVLAGRDAQGREPLFWGPAPGARLHFASSLDYLPDCAPTATAFPPGCVFFSEGCAELTSPGDRGFRLPAHCDRPGTVVSFAAPAPVRAVPRITSKGVLCGAVYRVASGGDLAGRGCDGY